MAARERLPPAFDAAEQVAIETGDTAPLVAVLLDPNTDLPMAAALRSRFAGLLHGRPLGRLSRAQERQRRVREMNHELRSQGYTADEARDAISSRLGLSRDTVDGDLHRADRAKARTTAKTLLLSAPRQRATLAPEQTTKSGG